MLGIARARADAIVTTGSILRAEPELVHAYHEDPDLDAGLAEWRRRTLGRSQPPRLVVLSASGRFPDDHPALGAARAGFVWTTEAGRALLPTRLGPLSVRVPTGAASASAAIASLLEEPGVESVLIEAGPSTAAALYPAPSTPAAAGGPWIDELLLSRFEGSLAPAAEGPAFVPEETIRARLGSPVSSVRIEEPSGPWRFERYRAAG